MNVARSLPYATAAPKISVRLTSGISQRKSEVELHDPPVHAVEYRHTTTLRILGVPHTDLLRGKKSGLERHSSRTLRAIPIMIRIGATQLSKTPSKKRVAKSYTQRDVSSAPDVNASVTSPKLWHAAVAPKHMPHKLCCSFSTMRERRTAICIHSHQVAAQIRSNHSALLSQPDSSAQFGCQQRVCLTH